MVMEGIAAVISALGAILTGYFAYNQYTKNRMTDVKIENWKKEEQEKLNHISQSIAKIYGEMWHLLHELKADRVYIIQPHPLTSSLYVSITLEVKRNCIVEIKRSIINMPMAEIAAFSSDMASRDWMFYKDVEQEMKDKKARAILSTSGSKTAIVKRLSDDDRRWIGSLFCDFTREQDFKIDYAKKLIAEAANNIQFILPEYRINQQ